MRIYLVQTGLMGGGSDHLITYLPVVGFSTRRVAEAVARQRQREHPYECQYDEVVGVNVYRTRAQWQNGLQQRAKVAKVAPRRKAAK